MQRTLLFLFLAFPFLVSSQNEKSLSPYFIVNVDSGESIPDFPLHSTSADVTISGVIADVVITQVYINRSSRALEAVYVFPGSTNAAVYAMEMQVGRRTIEAKIMERQAARAGYEEAKQQGKTTSLLEQERPNIFTMNVANVMPGDSIIVRMSYTERLVPTEGVYEFVYPTVVAPRYTGAGAPIAALDNQPRTQAGEIPYSTKGAKPGYTFDITVNIASGIPFEFIRSTSHKVLLSFESPKSASVLLDKSESLGGDRDYILQYRFAGGKIETGLMLYEGKDENYFMLMMEPPKRVPLDSIPPREYIFIMDVSGSMSGYPLETSKKLLRNLVGGLRLTDKFNVIQFAGGGAQFMPQSTDATTANIDSAIVFISHAQAGGGTELNNAMRMAMFLPEQEGYCRSIVIVTDGLISAEATVLQSMRNHLDSANVFAFGIGSSCNRYLIEAMAFCGNGEPTVVMKDTEADSAAERFRRYISSPVLSNVKITYDGFQAYDVDPVAVPDLFASRPLIITGKYQGRPAGTISVSGITGTSTYQKQIHVDSVKPSKKNKAIRLLWARDRIKYLTYLDSPGNQYYYRASGDTTIKKEIQELGLKYSLLTNYTSFLAVDKRERNKNPEFDSLVPQVLPLPAGMDNSAVGMTGTLNQVSIVSGGVVACYASVSACEITITRPIFSAPQTSGQDPATAGDFNRFYNGGFILPVMSNYAQPFFTAGASGRMSNLMNVDMLGTYTIGTYGIDGAQMCSPLNTGSFSFNGWLPDKNRLTVSATHYGVQNLYYANQWSISERLQSVLEVSEQWKGTSTDRNEDGFEDVNKGTNLTVHHRLTYDYKTRDLYHSRMFQNDLYVHSSWLTGGQIAEPGYATHDRTFGFYMAPRAFIEIGDGKYLDLKFSGSIASLNQGWGIDRFHSNTSQFAGGVNYHWGYGMLSYNAGIDGWIASGEERWNVARFSAGHQSAGVQADVKFNKDLWRINGAVRTEYNDVGGFVVLPSVKILRDLNEDVYVSLSGYRYRDVPFAIGQLQPLFFSSRQLEVADNLGLNQGWDFKANVTFSKLFRRDMHLSLSYEVLLPERTIVIDLDSDVSKTSVYDIEKGNLIHRAMSRFNSRIGKRMDLDAEYLFTYSPYMYSENSRQQPLLPMHRSYASLTWKDYSGRFHIRGQVCYTGSQRIPQSGWSDDFVTVNLELKYKFANGRLTAFANVFNLLDYRQKDVIFSTNEQMDGWKIWAPVMGRTFQAGVSFRF